MYYLGSLALVNVLLNVFRGKVKDYTYLANFAGILRSRYAHSFKSFCSVRKKSLVR